MKRFFRFVLPLVASALVACSAISGCGSDESGDVKDVQPGTSSNIAIVYADRANSGVKIADIGEVRDAVETTVTDEGFIAAILADGKPQVIKANFTLESNNGTRLKKEIDGNVNGVINMNYGALTEECDVFNSIVNADRALGSAANPERKNLLIVIDSGISTKGPIDFTQAATKNALLDPEGFANELADEGYLTNFQNVQKVIWYGMGVSSNPQGVPVAGTVSAMQDLYTAVFKKAGVTDVTFKPATESISDSDNLPPVTVVNMPRVSDKKIGDSLTLDEREASFTFKSGMSEFNDPAAAKKNLKVYIDQLLDFPDLKVTIYGYTDTKGSEELNKALSKKRADAVKDLLVSSGVSKKQITTVGKGESSKYSSLKQNRRVEIVFG